MIKNENCRYARWGQTDKEWVYVLWYELGQCRCIDNACLFFVNKYKEWERQRDEKNKLSELHEL